MTEYLGHEVDDEFVTYLVDSFLDGYDLAGGSARPSVGEVLEELRRHGVETAFVAGVLGRNRAERELGARC